MRFTARNGRFTTANASRLGKLGAAAKAKKRMEQPRDPEPRRVPDGELLGALTCTQWLAGFSRLPKRFLK